MSLKAFVLTAVVGALAASNAAPAFAQSRRGPTKCSSILAVCLQRAGPQGVICEEMYQRAVSNGQWPATEEPDGTKHAAVTCTK